MHERFLDVNKFWLGINEFLKFDKHLSDLSKYRYVYYFDWDKEIKLPGINVLFGGRQIGKTTALKLYVKKLLNADSQENKINPKQIFYLPCDSILDRDVLYRTIKSFLASINNFEKSYLLIDEATLVKGWEITIKAIIDEGGFKNAIVIITGSDSVVLEDAASAFPGVDRRGQGRNYYLKPLSFRQFVKLVDPEIKFNSSNLPQLQNYFNSYLNCGGYLNAINDLMMFGKMSESIFATYEDWIVSDFVRKGKQKKKLIELLRVILEKSCSQLSFNKIAQATENISTDTVIDYIHHLERLGVLKVLSAFNQNTLSDFPKKEKKIHFTDPLLSHVIVRFLKREQILAANFELVQANLVESVVVSEYSEVGPRYYIKAEGEVDLVVVKEAVFYPIEVKWSEQVRSNEIKQILKYPNGLILSKQPQSGSIGNIKIENLVMHLLKETLID